MNARLKAVPPSLGQIEALTKTFAQARSLLAERVDAAKTEREAILRRALPGIKSAVASAEQAKAELHAAIEAAPAGTFEKPRTHIFHGIKVGYRKGSGKLSFEDEARVVALIEKHLPDQVDVLIKVEKSPVKSALANLGAAELKKLGVTIEDTGDVVEIRAIDDEVEKLVKALLKGAPEEEGK